MSSGGDQAKGWDRLRQIQWSSTLTATLDPAASRPSHRNLPTSGSNSRRTLFARRTHNLSGRIVLGGEHQSKHGSADEDGVQLGRFAMRLQKSRLQVEVDAHTQSPGQHNHSSVCHFHVKGPYAAVSFLRAHVVRVKIDEGAMRGTCTPLVKLHIMDLEAQRRAGIPEGAKKHCFLFPMDSLRGFALDLRLRMEVSSNEPWLSVLLYGGFAYFDEADKWIGTNGYASTSSEPPGDGQPFLWFDGPHDPVEDAVAAMMTYDRLVPVTSTIISHLGFTTFGYVGPGETIDGKSLDGARLQSNAGVGDGERGQRFHNIVKLAGSQLHLEAAAPAPPSSSSTLALDGLAKTLLVENSSRRDSLENSSRRFSLENSSRRFSLKRPPSVETSSSVGAQSSLPGCFVFGTRSGRHFYYQLVSHPRELQHVRSRRARLHVFKRMMDGAFFHGLWRSCVPFLKLPSSIERVGFQPYTVLVREIRRTGNPRVEVSLDQFVVAACELYVEQHRAAVWTANTRREMKRQLEQCLGGASTLSARAVFDMLVRDGTVQPRYGNAVAKLEGGREVTSQHRAATTARTMWVDLEAEDAGYDEWMRLYLLHDVDEGEAIKAQILGQEEREAMEKEEKQREEEDGKNAVRFYFVHRDTVLAATQPLKRFQELRREKKLTAKLIDRARLCRHRPSREAPAAFSHYVAISHRWEQREIPDSGVQLRALQQYLRNAPAVGWVWYDYWCMPQAGYPDRTPAEWFEFSHMLRNVNWLYLSTRVLVLVDLSYLSRFWVRHRPPRSATSRPTDPLAWWRGGGSGAPSTSAVVQASCLDAYAYASSFAPVCGTPSRRRNSNAGYQCSRRPQAGWRPPRRRSSALRLCPSSTQAHTLRTRSRGCGMGRPRTMRTMRSSAKTSR